MKQRYSVSLIRKKKTIWCPVRISKIPKFEKRNKVSVNVFGFEDGIVVPVFSSTEKFKI